jgi:hypothetical protein
MQRYVLIKSERSLRHHKAAGARFEYVCADTPVLPSASEWYFDDDPEFTLRELSGELLLRAVYEEPTE